MRFALRPTSYTGRRLILHADQLEQTRQRSDPRTGPLVGYVIDDGFSNTWLVNGQFPTKEGVFARVSPCSSMYTTGWAPLEAVAEVLDWGSPGVGAKLREAGPSDTSSWTVAVFGSRWGVTRTSYTELVAAQTDDLEYAVADEDSDLREAEEKAELEAASTDNPHLSDVTSPRPS